MNITIIGAGKVGSALAIELFDKGYKIFGIVDKSRAKARKLGKVCDCNEIFSSVTQKTVNNSDLILLSISDDDLTEYHKVVKDIDFKGRMLAHTSGLLTSEIFKDYDVYRKDSASFHPVQTFPVISYKNNNFLKGIYLSIEGGERALKVIKGIIHKLGSNEISLSRNKKSLFHLGCVISSNFTVANFYILKEFSRELGISEKKFLNVLNPLFVKTVENINKKGVIGTLTGPVVRGDITTIQSHIELLHGKFPKFVEYYKHSSKILSEISVKQNMKVNIKRILDILS